MGLSRWGGVLQSVSAQGLGFVCRQPPTLSAIPTPTHAQEVLNSFVFQFGSRPAQLSRLITFDLLGIPQDYLFRRACPPDRLLLLHF